MCLRRLTHTQRHSRTHWFKVSVSRVSKSVHSATLWLWTLHSEEESSCAWTGAFRRFTMGSFGNVIAFRRFTMGSVEANRPKFSAAARRPEIFQNPSFLKDFGVSNPSLFDSAESPEYLFYFD